MNLKINVLVIMTRLKLMPLNDEQRKHISTTFRLFGFAVLGAIGWPALTAGHWYELLFAAIVFVLSQYIALLYLEKVEK